MRHENTIQEPRVRYLSAYPTGRELMREPRYGCAEEALLRREAARSAPEGSARSRARALSFITTEYMEDHGSMVGVGTTKYTKYTKSGLRSD